MKDPRTVARDIPGISNVLFPQLSSGLVAYLNKDIRACPSVKPVPLEIVKKTLLSRAMLFEVAFARGQQILKYGMKCDWNDCIKIATNRQKRHFDAHRPADLEEIDFVVAEWVADNLFKMVEKIRETYSDFELIHSPVIPGYQWISSSEGDLSVGTKLIEVKCTNNKFSAADYRQVMMYWLLSYADSIENNTREWEKVILLNPRNNQILDLSFNEIIELMAAGRSKIEILELFAFIVGDYSLKSMSDIGQ